MQEELKEITGINKVTLQPAAGAHGEWTALMIFKASMRIMVKVMASERCIIPICAHGTNYPADFHLQDLNQLL